MVAVGKEDGSKHGADAFPNLTHVTWAELKSQAVALQSCRAEYALWLAGWKVSYQIAFSIGDEQIKL